MQLFCMERICSRALSFARGVVELLFCMVSTSSRALSFARSVADLCCVMLVRKRAHSSTHGVVERLFCVVRSGIGSHALFFARGVVELFGCTMLVSSRILSCTWYSRASLLRCVHVRTRSFSSAYGVVELLFSWCASAHALSLLHVLWSSFSATWCSLAHVFSFAHGVKFGCNWVFIPIAVGFFS